MWEGAGKMGGDISSWPRRKRLPKRDEGQAGTLGAALAAASRALALVRAAQAMEELCLPKLFQMRSGLQ